MAATVLSSCNLRYSRRRRWQLLSCPAVISGIPGGGGSYSPVQLLSQVYQEEVELATLLSTSNLRYIRYTVLLYGSRGEADW